MSGTSHVEFAGADSHAITNLMAIGAVISTVPPSASWSAPFLTGLCYTLRLGKVSVTPQYIYHELRDHEHKHLGMRL